MELSEEMCQESGASKRDGMGEEGQKYMMAYCADRCNFVLNPGTGIMEADDRQVTTAFTVQLSFRHRCSTNPVS